MAEEPGFWGTAGGGCGRRHPCLVARGPHFKPSAPGGAAVPWAYRKVLGQDSSTYQRRGFGQAIGAGALNASSAALARRRAAPAFPSMEYAAWIEIPRCADSARARSWMDGDQIIGTQFRLWGCRFPGDPVRRRASRRELLANSPRSNPLRPALEKSGVFPLSNDRCGFEWPVGAGCRLS